MQHKDAPHIKTESPTAAIYLIKEINKSYSKELSSTEKRALRLLTKTKDSQDHKKTTDTIINKLFNTLLNRTMLDYCQSWLFAALLPLSIIATLGILLFADATILPWQTAFLIIGLLLLAQAIPFLICALVVSTRVSITKHTAASNYLKANKIKSIEMVPTNKQESDKKGRDIPKQCFT